VLGWVHIRQTPIHHLKSGSFTSYSKGREIKAERPPREGLGQDMKGSEGALTVVNSRLPNTYPLNTCPGIPSNLHRRSIYIKNLHTRGQNLEVVGKEYIPDQKSNYQEAAAYSLSDETEVS
jgi:hypothetical protein